MAYHRELRAAFLYKPSSYKVSIIPTKKEIENLQNLVSANLRNTTRLIHGSSNKEEMTKTISIPEMLHAKDPGPFIVQKEWTYNDIAQEKEKYAQDRFRFQYKTYLEQACLLDLLDAIPSAFIVKFLLDKKGDPSVASLLKCMEDVYELAPTRNDVVIHEEIEELYPRLKSYKRKLPYKKYAT